MIVIVHFNGYKEGAVEKNEERNKIKSKTVSNISMCTKFDFIKKQLLVWKTLNQLATP